MKSSLIIITVLLFVLSSCKDKEPKITSTLDIHPEMKAYFVDYAVGTKWIYQDTLDDANFDTIELVRIEPYDKNRKGVLEKGTSFTTRQKSQKILKFQLVEDKAQIFT